MTSSEDEQHLCVVVHPSRLSARYHGAVTPHSSSDAPDTGRDLRGRHLAGEDFSAADLRLANLVSANLAGAMFTDADLSRARMHGSRLRHAELDRANLSGVAARDIDMEGASLQGTVLSDADLRGAIFLEADLPDWRHVGRRNPGPRRPGAGVSRRRKRNGPQSQRSETAWDDGRSGGRDSGRGCPLAPPSDCRTAGRARGATARCGCEFLGLTYETTLRAHPEHGWTRLRGGLVTDSTGRGPCESAPVSGTRYRVDATPPPRRRHTRGRKHRDTCSTRRPDPAASGGHRTCRAREAKGRTST